MRAIWLGLLLTVLGWQCTAAGDVLASLRPEHPRLLLTAQDAAELRQLIATDALAREWYGKLCAQADALLDQAPLERKLQGVRMLSVSHAMQARIVLLGGLYRLGGKPEYKERAVAEMRAAAAFSDWNPVHFLDTAELTAGLAIGYDWLYSELTPEDRALIERAIIEKGLQPGAVSHTLKVFWVRAPHNWNQVCHGGLLLGALAVAEADPALCRLTLEQALAGLPLAMANFAPDGGWAEGPGYWAYATEYNVLALAALESALGSDQGLGALPGFDRAGEFRLATIAPSGKCFNFADCNEGAAPAPQMLYLARRYRRGDFAADELARCAKRPSPWHLYFYRGQGDVEPGLVHNKLFRHAGAAVLTGHAQTNQAWVGFKAGDNRANHSHLDLGSLIAEWDGRRFALDPGRDDYDLPGYFGAARFGYYRLGTAGHNTLCIDGANQDPKAQAALELFQDSRGVVYAVADLSAAYAPAASSVWRGCSLVDDRWLLVQDELALNGAHGVCWQLLTPAQVSLDGARAVLALDGHQIEARILAPAGARFSTAVPQISAPQRPLPGVTSLRIELAAQGAARIAVLLGPKGAPELALRPLGAWRDG